MPLMPPPSTQSGQVYNRDENSGITNLGTTGKLVGGVFGRTSRVYDSNVEWLSDVEASVLFFPNTVMARLGGYFLDLVLKPACFYV